MGQIKSALFLIVFGLVFLAVGVGMGYFSVGTLNRANAMRAWRETPATVLSCNLQVSHSSKGGSSYRVEARYQYEVAGVRHTGDRVSLYSGSDNIGSFQRDLYETLKRAMDRKEPTTCWVNPQNPGEAVLSGKLRPEMLLFMQLFVLAFGGAGLAVVLSGVFALVQPSGPAEGVTGAGHIRMNGAAAHRVAAGLALVWNGYVGWLVWSACHALAPDSLPWPFWLLAASGVIPAGVAGYLVGRFRKFGISCFEMSPMPGVLGGPVSGTIRIPARVETEDGFDVSLRCIHQYTTGSGKSSSTHCDVQWEDSRHIDGGLSYGDETMLPVRFAVPYGESPTTAAGGRNGYYWRLTATAAAPGIDYKAVFDVPVKQTAQSSPEFGPHRMPEAAACHERVDVVAARAGLRLSPNPDGGFELVFPAARAWLSGLFLALFVAGWSGVCYVLWAVAKAPLMFAAVFTVVDAVMVLVLLNTLFVSRGIVVDRSRGECVVWWRAAFFPRSERRIPFAAVTDVRSERAGQSGNTVYYRVVLSSDGGTPATLGSGLKMWSEAEAVAEYVKRAVQLK